MVDMTAVLRRMAMARARGELESMLETFSPSTVDAPELYDRLEVLITEFFEKLEDAGV